MLTTALRRFLLALQFFTRLPLPAALATWVGYSPALMQRVSAWLPAVGWVVGALAAAVAGLAMWLWPPAPHNALAALLAATLATACGLWATGAFHEDGLADTCDGLGGSASAERALAIMKDPRLGSYGVLGLGLAVLLKVLLLALLAQRGPPLTAMTHGMTPAPALPVALLAGHVLSRLAPLWLMRALPYVSEAGQAKSGTVVSRLSGADLALGCALAAPALALLAWCLGPYAALLALLGWALALLYMVRLLRRRLQGITGDTLGASQQACELALYLALALPWANASCT